MHEALLLETGPITRSKQAIQLQLSGSVKRTCARRQSAKGSLHWVADAASRCAAAWACPLCCTDVRLRFPCPPLYGTWVVEFSRTLRRAAVVCVLAK